MRSVLLPALVALLAVTAGCGGVLPGADDGTPATDDGGDGGDLPPAEQVKADALAAIDGVETYRTNGSVVTVYTGGVDRTINATVEGRFDRTDRRAYINQTQSVLGRSVVVETYVVDGTVYQHSDQYVQRFDSEWIRTEAGNDSRTWDRYDTLSRQRALLNVSNVSVAGTERVDGTETYVLEAEPDPDRLDELGLNASRGNFEVRNVSATFYVATDSGRLVRSTTRLVGETTARDQTIQVDQQVDLRFTGYGDPVEVQLPEGADDAVAVGGSGPDRGEGNATTGTGTENGTATDGTPSSGGDTRTEAGTGTAGTETASG